MAISSDQKKQINTAPPSDQQDMARCLFCGQPEQLVWVHGHGQCAHCGVNAMPCCDGAECVIDPQS
ncbi:MAG: hypothetical protein EBU10_07615 [Alphaproteobacteria bacterium]|nr:hypothetical protein [Alphaproteobacteria bacterium]